MNGEELKLWREGQGKSQKELADDLDVSRHSVMKWERSDRIPRLLELAISALQKELPPIVAGKGSTIEEIMRGRNQLDTAILMGIESRLRVDGGSE
ncbi:helix-turn-helix domain-containing protein [Rhizobium sp. CRIBSB]|nr:helix-turn-helix domain-containing protein [Rhizobium sp. CRIBSB]